MGCCANRIIGLQHRIDANERSAAPCRRVFRHQPVCLLVLDVDRIIIGLSINPPECLAHFYARNGAGAGRNSRYGVHLTKLGNNR